MTVKLQTKGVLNPTVGFDTKKMRKHLQSCLESGILSCFPTVLRRPNIRNRNRTKRKSIPINLHCKCRLPDCVRELVKCASCKICFICMYRPFLSNKHVCLCKMFGVKLAHKRHKFYENSATLLFLYCNIS